MKMQIVQQISAYRTTAIWTPIHGWRAQHWLLLYSQSWRQVALFASLSASKTWAKARDIHRDFKMFARFDDSEKKSRGIIIFHKSTSKRRPTSIRHHRTKLLSRSLGDRCSFLSDNFFFVKNKHVRIISNNLESFKCLVEVYRCV